MEIKNNTFVITGAAQGLGEAIAISLAKQGAKLALLDVNAEQLDQVLARCTEVGAAECFAFTCDVADETSVLRSFAALEERLGTITGLVNNAGILRDALLVKVKEGEIVDRLSLEQWQQVIDINLTGVFLCGREAASSMIRNQQPGVIINISSISRAGNIGQSNYAAAKSGVAALTTTWARELARYQIRCAAIAPGVFETEMVASLKPEAHERITSAVPLQRTGAVEELAHAIRFIIENDYYSGRILELDGGLRL
ncbi:MAG TPA: SDR family oxidoreductase [Gammaproteobacteria bacterium]|nr:SDR family oxidoreductase [Gammaproteobacteria bacterium]